MQGGALETAKTVGDGTSLGVVVLSLLQYIPEVTAALSLIWICFRLYELKTIQGWIYGKEEKNN